MLEKNICSLAKEYLILVGALGFWGMTLAIVDVRAAFVAAPVASRNLAVQGLRGMAALAVMLFHANFSRASTWPFDEHFGYLGVAVFFAISGMLMASILPRTEPWRFLSHRIVRIYPLYLLLVAIALAGLQKYLVPIACAWLVAIAAAQLTPGWNGMALPVGPSILFNVPSAAFAGGLLVPTLARRVPIGLSVVAIAVCFLFWPETVSARYWVVSVAATFLVLDVSRLRVAAPGLATLGDWSYALYLCHFPAFVVAQYLAPGAPLLAGLLGAFGAAAIFGTLDVWLYAHLKTEVDRFSDELRKRSVLWYLAIFSAAIPAALVIP